MLPIRIVIEPVPADEAGAWRVRAPDFETRYPTRAEAIRAARTDANRRMTDGVDSQLVVHDGDGRVDHVERFTRVSATRAVARRCPGAPRPSIA